jgi:hypothetical protein
MYDQSSVGRMCVFIVYQKKYLSLLCQIRERDAEPAWGGCGFQSTRVTKQMSFFGLENIGARANEPYVARTNEP